jgi:signal transduction histidine kinase
MIATLASQRQDLAGARQLLESGALKEALEALGVTLSDGAHDPASCYLMGLAQFRREAWPEAVAAFDRALGQVGDPPDPELTFWHGMALLKSGQAVEAKAELEGAATAGHMEACYQLALQYARDGRRQRDMRTRAVEHLEAILTSAGEQDSIGTLTAGLDRVCFTLGGLYLDSNGEESLQRGIEVFRRGLAINPLSAVGHNSLGLLLKRAGHYLGALGECKLAIQLDPDYKAAYTNLAQLLCEHVDPTDLTSEYAHVIEEFGDSAPRVIAALSVELMEQGRSQTQREMYTKSHQLKNLLGLVGSRLRRVGRKVTRHERSAPMPAAQVNEVGSEILGVEAEYERLYEEWVGFLAALTPDTLYTSLVEPGRVVERVLDALAPRAGATALKLRTQEGVPRIQADERLLREVVTNLCINALEATAEPGADEGAAEGAPGVEISVGVGYDASAGVVFVEVEDLGSGIAPEYIDHVFDPGFTTKQSGSGYGLSIARRIALAHHGDLRVKSKVGHGSVFRLDIPVNFEAEGSPDVRGFRHHGG